MSPKPMPQDDVSDMAEPVGRGGRLMAYLQGLMRRPLIAGVLCGLLAFGAYGIYFSDTAPTPAAEVLYLDGADVLTVEPLSPIVTPNEDVADATINTPQVPTVWEYALVVSDTGLQRRALNAIQDNLPVSVGVAVSVYAPDAQNIVSALSKSGRQVWLQLAVQTLGARPDLGIDAGGLALLAKAPREQNRAQLERQISVVDKDIRGFYVRSNADITLVPDMWRELAQSLIERRFMVLDSTPAPVAASLNGSMAGAPSAYLKSHVVLQGNAYEPSDLVAKLNTLGSNMMNEGVRIVVIENANANDMVIIGDWIESLAAAGIKLVETSKFSHL